MKNYKIKQIKEKLIQWEYKLEDKLVELHGKLMKFFHVKELKPLGEMTDEEIRLEVQRDLRRTKEPAPYRYDGLDYSRHYLRTHTPEEIEARWNADIDTLMKMIDVYGQELQEFQE